MLERYIVDGLLRNYEEIEESLVRGRMDAVAGQLLPLAHDIISKKNLLGYVMGYTGCNDAAWNIANLLASGKVPFSETIRDLGHWIKMLEVNSRD
jgi:hypothetical protein